MTFSLSKGSAIAWPLLNHSVYFAFIFYFLIASFPVAKGATVHQPALLHRVDSLINQHGYFAKARALLLPFIEADASEKAIDPDIYFRMTDIEIRSHNFKEAQYYLRRLANTEAYRTDPAFAYRVNSFKAYIYSYTGRHDQAIIIIEALIEDLKKRPQQSRRLSVAYNALGISMAELQMDKTEDCFLKSIAYGHQANTIVFASYNNLIDFYIETLNYKTASVYLDSLMSYSNESEQAIHIISAKTKQAYLFSKIGLGREAKNLMYEYWQLRKQYEVDYQISDMIFDSYVYHANGDLDSALFYAEPVLEYALQKKEMGLAEDCMHQLTKLYNETGQLERAIDIYQRLTVMQTTHNKINQIENISVHETPAQDQIELDSRLTFLQGWVCALLLCGGLATFFWYEGWLSMATKESPPPQEDLYLQLDIKNELLIKSKLARQQSIDFLTLLKTDIRQLCHDRNKLQKNINALIHRINDSIHFQSKWEEITLHFSERYPSFLPQLKAKYPKLTDTELRHCMFLKLHLTIDEIAQILNIETTSVSSARYRLKKKVDIERMMEWT